MERFNNGECGARLNNSEGGIPKEIRGRKEGKVVDRHDTSNNSVRGGEEDGVGNTADNNNSPSPTRNNIQLEISTEDGGSMNIQREVTLENVSLSNTTSDSFQEVVEGEEEVLNTVEGEVTESLREEGNMKEGEGNIKEGGLHRGNNEEMGTAQVNTGGSAGEGNKGENAKLVNEGMVEELIEGLDGGRIDVAQDGKVRITRRRRSSCDGGEGGEELGHESDANNNEGPTTNTNNNSWKESENAISNQDESNSDQDATTEQGEEEHNNSYSNYLDTTSVITNSMSVITDVIDNYSSSISGSAAGHGIGVVGGGVTTSTSITTAVGEGGVTSSTTTNTSNNDTTITTTTTVEQTLQDAGNAVYDAVALFLSDVGLDTTTTTSSPTTTTAAGGSNTIKVANKNEGGNNSSSSSSSAHPRRKSWTEVDMLTGLVLDDDGSQVTAAMRSTNSIGTQSQKSKDDGGGGAVGVGGVVNPPQAVSESVNPAESDSNEGLVEGSQILVKKKKKKQQQRDSSVLEEEEEEEGAGTFAKKDQFRHEVENKVLEGCQHEEEDEDEVRNSNSDEYYYQNAHSHENHHHSHAGCDETHNDDVREGPLSLSAQNVLGTSVKSLMDGSSSSSADSSGEVVAPSNNLVQVTGAEFMDVPCRSRRKPQQGGVGGAVQEMPSTSSSSQGPLQCAPMTTSSSSAQGSNGMSPTNSGTSGSNPSSQYKKQGGDESSFNSDMMELQRGLPMSSPIAGDASRSSDMMELHRGLPMSSPMAVDASRSSDMELQRGMPMTSPMAGDASRNSSMMELQHGSPMLPDRSESPSDDGYKNVDHHDRVHSPIRRRDEAIHTMAEALSLHHQHQPTPQSIVIDTKKPEIPDSYPSLMDALQSGSSFGSVTIATQSVGINIPHQALHNNGREYMDNEAEEILNVQDEEGEGRRENSVTYTEFDNKQQPIQGADQAAQAASLPSSSFPSVPSADGNVDPRMDIDYQRHYIVDLQPINEEGTSTSRSGVTSGENPQSENGGMNNNATENLHQLRQQQQFQPQAAQAAASLHQQQQQYHPMAPAPHQPNDQFFNYRHQYYQEKYQDDNETAQTSRYDDDTDSTCSSVTLSQAFHSSDESSVGLNSSVSSITFSQVDQHEHDQGFFIATKLGDFVQVPNEVDISEQQYDGDTLPLSAGAILKTAEEEKYPADQTSPNSDTITADNTEEVSNTTASPDKSKEVDQKQVGATAEDMKSDLIASIVPECGVPIPSVMAKVGTRRRKSSNTGFLVPWHSSRSIQNYNFGNQRKKGGRQQRNSSNSSLFSIGSVHTFRG